MQVEEYKDNSERRILTGMITDSAVLGRIAAKWDGKLFDHPVVNAIAQQTVDYYKKHQKAPGRDIEGIFQLWAEQQAVEENIRMGEKLLRYASKEYEQEEGEARNPEHIIDLAGKHFNRVCLDRLQERINAHLKIGQVEEADNAVTNYKRVEMGVGSGEDILLDKELVYSVFERQAEPLVSYPGVVGRFFGPVLGRDRFVAFLAGEKVGKSFWLTDLAWRLATSRKRVAFFEAGDDHEETRMRFLVRAGKRPDQSTDGKWPFTVKWPTSISPPAKMADGQFQDCAQVTHKEVVFSKHLDGRRAWKKCQYTTAEVIKSSTSYLRLSCHPSGSLSVADIRSILDAWSIEDWRADAVIIDYADLLATPNSKIDRLQQEDQTWMALRALSQRDHLLVATATQSTRESYGQKWLRREHVSGSKRKLAHVSAMLGINVWGKEKEDQLCRLNWIVRRKGASSSFVHVAGCLSLACPCVKSCF